MRLNRGPEQRPKRSGGFVLIALIAMLTMGALYFLMVQLEAVGTYQREARQVVSGGAPVDQAKEALLAYAATYRDDPMRSTEVFGYLPCPDTDGDGEAESTCGSAGNAAIGMLPYKTLGLPDLRDNNGTCLWYAVSGRVKANPKATGNALNWDVQGQFSITDANGSTLVAPEDSQGGAAAVIFSVGPPLSGQSRGGSATGPCGIDPSEVTSYLDGNYSFATSATIALVQGPINNAEGRVTNNDKLAWISPKDIFNRIVLRKDFSNALTATPAGQINTLIDRTAKAIDKQIQEDIFGGTSSSLPNNTASYIPQPSGAALGEIDSSMDISLSNTTNYANYLSNWADQFRMIRCSSLGTPCLSVNGSNNCRGALVFSGRTATGQPRTSEQKTASVANLANYFESGLNLLTAAGIFSGSSSFSESDKSLDVAACLGAGTFVSLVGDSTQFAGGVVSPGGGGSAIAGVTGAGTSDPTIVLGSTTTFARSGCIWFPTPLSLNSSMRIYYKYQIDSATTGSSARGYTLALADAATNNPYLSDPLMCGAGRTTANARMMGYAGTPASGTATVGGSVVSVSGASWSPSTSRATINTATTHGFSAGNSVTIAGVSPSGYNGTYSIVSTTTSSFTYSVAYPGPGRAGIAPPKIGVEFDLTPDTSAAQRNDPSSEHFALIYWGSMGDNNLVSTSTTQDGADDNYHGSGVAGDGSQPLNTRSLTTTTATATSFATITAARWSGGTATVATSAPHGLANGQRIAITDTSALGYKGTYVATVTDPTHFTVPITNSPGVYPYVTSISAATWSSGTASITTYAAHGLSNGHRVTISSIAPSTWNGTYIVTVTDATHFTYALASDPGTYSSGGLVSYPLNSVSGASWSSGIVTLTTAAAHNLVSNQYVTISGIAPSGYNGTYRITVIDATHFSYALTYPGVNPGSYLSGGLVGVAGMASTVMATSSTNISTASWSNFGTGTATITTSASHGLSIGRTVQVSGVSSSGPASYNGTFTVASVPTSTSFTYGLSTDPGSFSATAGDLVAIAAPSAPSINSLNWSSGNGGVATAVTAAAHGFASGQMVSIAGALPTGYNGTFAVSVVDATTFTYTLATDPGGSFAATSFATPGISTVKLTDTRLPYNGSMPGNTSIHVRIDVVRSYDSAAHRASLTVKTYIGDTFPLGDGCLLADLKNLSRDLSEICPLRTATVEQYGIPINDVAGPAMASVYLGFTTARNTSSNDNQTVNVSDLILRSQ